MWMVAFGSAKRRPLVPAVSSTVPKEAVTPTASVLIGFEIICIVS